MNTNIKQKKALGDLCLQNPKQLFERTLNRKLLYKIMVYDCSCFCIIRPVCLFKSPHVPSLYLPHKSRIPKVYRAVYLKIIFPTVIQGIRILAHDSNLHFKA